MTPVLSKPANALLAQLFPGVFATDATDPKLLLPRSAPALSPFVARVRSEFAGLTGSQTFVAVDGQKEPASPLFTAVIRMVHARGRDLAGRYRAPDRPPPALSARDLIQMSAKLREKTLAYALDFVRRCGLQKDPLALLVQRACKVDRESGEVSYPDLCDLWEELQANRKIDGVLIEVFCALCNARADLNAPELEDLTHIRGMTALGIPGLAAAVYDASSDEARRAIRFCIPLRRVHLASDSSERLGRWPWLRFLKVKSGIYGPFTVSIFRLHCPRMGKVQLSASALPNNTSGLELDIGVLGTGPCGFKKSTTVCAELDVQHCCVDFELELVLEYTLDRHGRPKVRNICSNEQLITTPRPDCETCLHTSIVAKSVEICKVWPSLSFNLSDSPMGETPRKVCVGVAPTYSLGGVASLTGPMKNVELEVQGRASRADERQIFASYTFPTGFNHIGYKSAYDDGLFPSFSWEQ